MLFNFLLFVSIFFFVKKIIIKILSIIILDFLKLHVWPI